MTIAIVLNTSWNVYNFRLGLIKALQKEGYKIVVIAPEDKYSPRLIDEGCQFIPVKMDSRGANIFKDFALTIELLTIYRRLRPDVILQYTIKPNIYGSVAAHLLKIPTINNVCGLGTVFLTNNLVSRIATSLYKTTFRFPQKVFFQNEDDRQLFIERKILKENITDVLPGSGVDINKFIPTPFNRNNKFTFLLISRLIHDKGIAEYIKAIELLRSEGVDAKFQILGPKDPEHSRGIPESIINEWIDNNVIEYLGTTDDVRNFISAADCVVLPSYREGTPKSLLEAASCSKPIVTTNVAGCKEVVENEINGYLCEPQDPVDLAAKMKQMAALSDLKLKDFGQNGRRKIIEGFNEEIIINKYLEAISNLKSKSF